VELFSGGVRRGETERRRGGIPVSRYVVEPSAPQVAAHCLEYRTVEEDRL
jgi:hypothetical protein